MKEDTPALEIKNFSFSYSSDWTGRKFPVVKDISLSVKRGESFGFLGHNGAGKTTTIKAILGLTFPTEGSIEIFGINHCKQEARKEVGYLPEQPYFYDHLTVTELVTMYAKLAGVPSNKLSTAVKNSIERVNVQHKYKAPMHSLSKGLMQRVAMAQAIVAEPKLLILDEPFSGLDPLGRKEFKDLLFELKEGGTTIFISSHILEDIEFLCDRASIMAHGELRLILDLHNLAEHVERKYELTLEKPLPAAFSLPEESVDDRGNAYSIEFHSRESAEKCLLTALQQGATISHYSTAHGNLEDLFVQLVSVEEAA